MNRFWKNKIFIIALCIVAAVLFCSNFALAQDDLGLGEVAEEAGIAGETDPRVVIAKIIRIAFGFLGVIAIVLVTYGGFVWMTAGGDADKVAKAKKILVNAFIGLAIILLAFSITSFIISRLEEAAGLGGGEYEAPPGDGGIPGGPGGPGAFRVKSIQPVGDIPIRNVIVRATLSHKVNPNTIVGNVIVTNQDSGEEVSGTLESSSYTILFTPDSPCPEPNNDLFCFDENTIYNVRINNTIENEEGDNLYCGLGSVCSIEFTTGSLIDTAAPNVSVTSPFNNQAISEFSFFTLAAQADDDSAISNVEFYVDDQLVGADGPVELAASYLAQLEWDNSGYELGSHSVYAVGFDIDSNQKKSGTKSFRILAAHCFDNQQNFDETGVDCGGIDCGSCTGDLCEEDGDCQDGNCGEAGVCVSYPIITGVSPAEGATGNLISVWGYGFGDFIEGQSKFEFTGADGEIVEADVGCGEAAADSWSDTQIVVRIPENAVTGHLKATNANGDWDDTENDRGWLGPFVVNPELVWPGLCSVTNQDGNPEGQFEDLVIANGENFGTSIDKFLFGSFEASVTGTWGDTTITGIRVPNITQGRVLTNVEVGGELSNPIEFNILTSEQLPEIIELDPDDGGVGQYVNIKGNNFGNASIPVFFIASDGTEILADTNFPEGCTASLWSDTEILVKVPQADLGNYSVQIKGAEVESNQMPFEIIDADPSPGICGLVPDNGPVGTLLDVYGEGFAPSGSFKFQTDISAAISNVAGDGTTFQAQVPPLAISGPVQYFSVENTGSNILNFTVGTCTPGSCDEGEECCTNGVCMPAGECEEALGAGECEYAWMFSTGILPLVPQVIEDQTCDEEHNQSPSPWKNSTDACANALIGARFNMDMQMDNIVDYLAVKRCRNQNDDCDFDNKDEYFVETIESVNTAGSLSEYFVVTSLQDVSQLQTNNWYQVTIKGGDSGIKNGDAIALPQDYVWKFKTRDTSCEIANVIVEPSVTKITEYLGEKVFTVYGQSENCNIIDVSAFSWSWMLIQSGNRAEFIDTSNEKSMVRAILETEPDQPVRVKASTFHPALGAISDEAELTIDFTDPKVIDKGPICDSACINATMWATFNTRMVESTVKDNIFLYTCRAQQCSRVTLEPYAINETDKVYNNETNTLYIYPMLEPNTFYRVVMTEQVTSLSSINLTGLNFDIDGDGIDDSYSWTFKTKNDDTLCDMDSADLSPVSYESSTIGELIDYIVNARGAPDECNASGQLINPYQFDWTWHSSKSSVATITDDQYSFNFPEKICSDQCLNLGSNPLASICGNGAVEYGEECDDSNTISTDGCSSVCLFEPVTDQEIGGTCGDGNLDSGEECDYAQDPDICTPGCQHAGSAFAGFECGDGSIDPGEDCDDSNSKGGDGCSSNCLWEGSTYSVEETDVASFCGNNAVEPGEDCDDGNVVGGDGCSARCLAEGSPATCGNSIIDSGENCEDGNTNDGDGCSSDCLAEGSDQSYNSFCGNGLPLEKGETCEASAASNFGGAPVQTAEVAGDISPFTNTDDTLISAMATNLAGESKQAQGDLNYTRGFCESISPQFAVAPTGDNICRNAAIQITVNQPVETQGLEDDITILYECSGDLTMIDKLIQFVYYKFDNLKNSILKTANAQRPGVKPPLFRPGPGSDPFGRFGSLRPCKFPIKDITVVEDEGNSIITVYPDGLLEADTLYTVDYSGLRDHCDAIFGQNSYEFTTGAQEKICLLDYVDVIPSDLLVTERNDENGYEAQARSNDLPDAPLNKVSGIYNWDWSWQLVTQVSDVTLEDAVSMLKFVKLDHLKTLKTGVTNGDAEVIATATITESQFGDNGESKSGTGQVTIFICENPWVGNDINDGIWQNNTYNFKTFYCRDAGNPGPDDDLPNLRIVPAPSYSGDAWSVDDPVVIKEYFVLRESGDINPDAIALRVYTNPEGISPAIWYDLHVPNPGEYEQFDIDCVEEDGNSYCYQAIRDGRTLYIDAGNYNIETNEGTCYSTSFVNEVTGETEFTSTCEPDVTTLSYYDNVYVFAFSENSSPQTTAIYNQLIENLRFNINLGQASGKAALRRDIKRSHDVIFLRSLVRNYQSQNGYLPLLNPNGTYTPGTYVNGQSISTWPSWNSVLGNLLGSGLPQDPINNFTGQCPEGYDPITCYNSETEDFYGEYDRALANIYNYQLSPDKASYNIDVNLEIHYDNRFPDICSNLEITCY